MAEKVKITFLGTGDQIPSRARNHSGILLNYKDENILVDCGEGTQRQFRKAGLNPCKITRILITHWHGDHVLGLPGLMQTLAASGYNKTLYLYGPQWIKEQIKDMIKVFGFKRDYEIEVKEISKAGKFFDAKDFFIEAEKMDHGIPCNAYNFVRKGSMRLDAKKLKKAKIPNGPFLKDLKNGKDIVVNGKKFKAKDFLYSEDELKISFILDTKLNPRIEKFVKSADLLISEASFDSSLEDKAEEHLHLTAEQVGKFAKKAKVNALVLTHISQRYDLKKDVILKDAKKNFKDVQLAKDFDEIVLK